MILKIGGGRGRKVKIRSVRKPHQGPKLREHETIESEDSKAKNCEPTKGSAYSPRDEKKNRDSVRRSV